jgi:hypothetical protein
VSKHAPLLALQDYAASATVAPCSNKVHGKRCGDRLCRLCRLRLSESAAAALGLYTGYLAGLNVSAAQRLRCGSTSRCCSAAAAALRQRWHMHIPGGMQHGGAAPASAMPRDNQFYTKDNSDDCRLRTHSGSGVN